MDASQHALALVHKTNACSELSYDEPQTGHKLSVFKCLAIKFTVVGMLFEYNLQSKFFDFGSTYKFQIIF